MATSTATRIHNFSAGPAILPVEVLEQAQRDLVSLPGVGMSILEISHRSAAFDEVIEGCEADVRALGNIPDSYRVLFLQGGASLQFSMVPMNLLPAGGSADYLVTGVWAEKAVKEAQRVGKVNIAASTAAEKHTRVPRADELKLDPNAAYVHLTTNNTIYGTQWHTIPDTGGVPLVADTSSDMYSRPIDVSKYGLIYAGAQKNLGPVRRHARHRPRGPARAHAFDAADDAAVWGARGEQVALQHAAGVRYLHHAARAAVADQGRRPARRSRRSTSARRASCTRRSTAPASIAATPPTTAARG